MKYYLVLLVMLCFPAFALMPTTVNCEIPTDRVNGDLMPLSEIDHLEFRVFADADLINPLEVHTETACSSTFYLNPGIYWYDVKVVDVWALESDVSDKLDKETFPNSSKPRTPMLRFVVANVNVNVAVTVALP